MEVFGRTEVLLARVVIVVCYLKDKPEKRKLTGWCGVVDRVVLS